jgi:hypothetical protein
MAKNAIEAMTPMLASKLVAWLMSNFFMV